MRCADEPRICIARPTESPRLSAVFSFEKRNRNPRRSNNYFYERAVTPAIYHLEAKIISRGVGRSAVAAAAYMSCSAIENDYDGIFHDYTRKGGLVYEHIYLPQYAPPAWSDRSILWNAVEENEKTKDSRLAREFIVALAVEFTLPEWIRQVEEFTEALVAGGMCVDVCIHDTDGHNPHAHIMATVRPLTPDGKWQKKTEKEYLCIKDGEERGFTAAEFKAVQAEGWEKQYQYYVDGEKKYLPPSQAADYERVNKYPKSMKFGRQNPISERWNSEEQLIAWRKLWAAIVNRALEEKQLDTRIDHRSFAVRGITEQPTIHEGVSARAVEGKGKPTERAEINRLIREDNKLLRTLRETVKKLTDAVMNSVEQLAEKLETLRINLIKLDFRRGKVRLERSGAESYVEDTGKCLPYAQNLIRELDAKKSELAEITKKLKRTPKILKKTFESLAVEKSGLHAQISELEFALRRELYHLCADSPEDLGRIQTRLEDTKAQIPKLQTEENNLTNEIESTLSDYRDTEELSRTLDQDRLRIHRRLFRLPLETEARQELNPKDTEFEAQRFNRSVDTVSGWIGEPPPHYLTGRERAWEEGKKRVDEKDEVYRRRQMKERERKLEERKAKDVAKKQKREIQRLR